MTAQEYLLFTKNEIHSTVFATVDKNGLPQTRVIDIMLCDEDSLYFLTAKGKTFYDRLTAQSYVALSGMRGKATQEAGYFVGAECIGCKLCYSVCPQKCINIDTAPAVIDGHHCIHCGKCAEICPKQAITLR